MASENCSATQTETVERILNNIDLVRRFTEGHDVNSFSADKRTLNAVTLVSELISYASRDLPPEMKAHLTTIAWDNLAALADRYRENYDTLQDSEVWQVATRDIEPLRIAMMAELRSLGGSRK